MDTKTGSANSDHHLTTDIAPDLEAWFAVAGDLDDFIFFWDDYEESTR